MRLSKFRSTATGKLLLSVAALGATASIAGLGTFATFTDSATADLPVSTGTVDIALGASGGTPGDATNRLTVAATAVAPDDTIKRRAILRNAGTIGFSSVTLTTTDTTVDPDTVLTTDTTNGLQVKIEKCVAGWVESGTSPSFDYTCADALGATTVLASRPVIGSAMALSGLTVGTVGNSDDLLVTLSLPGTADNTFQGKSATVRFSFDATQRAGALR
jgi:spore coat-associated protein N